MRFEGEGLQELAIKLPPGQRLLLAVIQEGDIIKVTWNPNISPALLLEAYKAVGHSRRISFPEN